MRKQIFYILFFCFMALPSFVQAQATNMYWLDGKWPHEKSSLPKHDKALYGRLSNGFRYIIQENPNPKDRVSMQLLVQVGSLMENEKERGIAHFLEHLAYNGSKNFPAGKLIPFFQSNGMTFGKDVNAYTSLKETVYKLSLLNKEQSIADGLLFMRDVADGILIEDAEVDAERGVIISEKNSRDSEKYRAGKHFRQFLFKDTEFQYDTIGNEDIIQTVSAKTIKDFYDAWYRPENMILMVVGSIQPQEVEKRIQQQFQDLQARAGKRSVFPFKDRNFEGIQTYSNTFKNEFTSVQIMTMGPLRWLDDSLAVQKEMLLTAMANGIVASRLRQMIDAGDAAFFSAMARFSEASGFFPLSILAASTKVENWSQSLEQLQETLLVALEFGFLPEEVAEAQKTFLHSYKRKVNLAKQEDNDTIIKNMIGCFMANRVYQSWEQTYAMYETFIKNTTPQELHAVFKQLWSQDNRILTASGNAKIVDAKNTLTALWKAGLSKKIQPVKALASINYPYVVLPKKAGEIKEHKQIPIKNTELVLHEITFTNGLLLRVLPTPFSKGKVHMQLALGSGTNALDDAHLIATKVAAEMDKFSALGNIARNDLLRLQGMEGLSVNAQLDTEFLAITSNGESKDIEKNLEALWTQYKDPSISAKDQELVLAKYAIDDEERKKELAPVMQTATRQLFWRESLRNTPITETMAKQYTLAELQQSIKALYTKAGAPVLNMVGDVDVAIAQTLVGKVFGAADVSWPALQKAPYEIQYAFATGGQREKQVEVDSALDQAAIRVAYHRPLTDVLDRKTLLTRRLVASILGDILRKAMREKYGAAYAPRVMYWSSDTSGYGLYLLNINTQHKNFSQMHKEIGNLVENFVAQGVNAETLQRMKRPMIGGWRQNAKQNKIYTTLLTLMVRSELPYLTWQSDFVPMVQSITLEEVNAEIKRAFIQENRAVVTGITTGKK